MAWGYRLLEAAGKKRGFLISGGEVDTERMAKILLDEYRAGKLGRFTLEMPEEYGNSLQRQNEGSAPMNCPSCGKELERGSLYTELGRGLFFLPPGGKVGFLGYEAQCGTARRDCSGWPASYTGERPRNCTWLCLPRLQKRSFWSIDITWRESRKAKEPALRGGGHIHELPCLRKRDGKGPCHHQEQHRSFFHAGSRKTSARFIRGGTSRQMAALCWTDR